MAAQSEVVFLINVEASESKEWYYGPAYLEI